MRRWASGMSVSSCLDEVNWDGEAVQQVTPFPGTHRKEREREVSGSTRLCLQPVDTL